MPRLFNVIRVTLFAAVLLFSLIVLGLAAWLQSILEPSDLSRFVPIAILVSVLTLLCVSAILFYGSREHSYWITQTRCELLLVTVLGGIWLGLSLIMSAQATPDVECPADDDGDPSSYTTDIFHAQYHVLQAFAILETLLLLGYAIFLFTLAMRHHAAGRKQVWNARVNEAQWFSPTKAASPSSEEKFTRLPPPVSASSRRKNGHRHNLSAPVAAAVVPEPTRNISTSAGYPLTHSRSRSAPTPAPAPVTAPIAAAFAKGGRPPPPRRQTTTPARPIVTPPPPPMKKSQTYVVYAPNTNNSTVPPPQVIPSRRPEPSRRATQPTPAAGTTSKPVAGTRPGMSRPPTTQPRPSAARGATQDTQRSRTGPSGSGRARG